MKIIEQPTANILQPPGAKSEAQVSARERAIQALMQGKNPGSDVVDKSQIPNPSIPKENLPPMPPEAEAKAAEMPAQNHNNGSSEQVEASVEAATTPEVKQESKPKDPSTEQYLKLARKEQELRRKEAQLRAKEVEMRRLAEESKKAAEIDPSKYIPKDKLLSDPLSALAEQGLTYDQLTELAMKSPKTPEQIATDNLLKQMEAKIASLEGKLEEGSKKAVEQQEQAYNQALNQLKTETRKLVNAMPDDFEMVKATNSYSDVVELIEKVYKSDGILLSVEEAARDVENYLVTEAERLSRLKKIQARVNKSAAASSSSPAAPAKSAPTAPATEAPVKNLTNANSASSRQLSRRERAILAAEGKLK